MTKATLLYKKFESTVSKYEKELERYSAEDFIRKPVAELWSIGQVYEHIISNTLNFHVGQIALCLSCDENKNKNKNLVGYLSLFLKRIPPVKINIPPEENIEPAQPIGKTDIKRRLAELKHTFCQLALEIDSSEINGKRNHLGFGYLNAKEWYALIEMHLRYHLKDKQIIDRHLYS